MCQDKWQSQDSNLHSLAPKPVPLTTTKCHPLHDHLILSLEPSKAGIMVPILQSKRLIPKDGQSVA